MLGYSVAEKVRREMKIKPVGAIERPNPDDIFGIIDWARLFLNAGFDWNRRAVAVLISPGMTELSIAAALEVFPRTLSARTVTIAPARKIISTAHNLWTVPTISYESSPRLDILVHPGMIGATKSLLEQPGTRQWIAELKPEVLDLNLVPAGQAFGKIFEIIGRYEGVHSTRIAAKLIEYPYALPSIERKHFPSPPLILRPIIIGFFGLLIATFLKKRLAQRREQRRELLSGKSSNT